MGGALGYPPYSFAVIVDWAQDHRVVKHEALCTLLVPQLMKIDAMYDNPRTTEEHGSPSQVAQTRGSCISRFKQIRGTLQVDPANCVVRRCPTELSTSRFPSFPLQLPVRMPQEELQELISVRRTGNWPQGCTRSGGGASTIKKKVIILLFTLFVYK